MSRLFILQLIFVAVLVISVFAIGIQLYGPGVTDYDAVISWGYAAAVGFAGGWICMIVRLGIRYRQVRGKTDS